MLRSRLLAQFATSTWILPGLLTFAALSYLPACTSFGDDESKECKDGSEGCACFGNDTCLKGLVCLSQLCVDPDGREPDASADDYKPSNGSKDNADEGDPVGDSGTAQPVDDGGDEGRPDNGSSDDEPSGPDDDSAHTMDTSTAVNADDDAQPTSDDATASAADAGSLEPAPDNTETDPDLTDPDVTDPTTDPSVDPPAPECTESTGSCSQGSALDCVEGSPVPGDCSACEILSCGVACCGSVWSLVAETYPYVQRDDARLSFTANSEQASVSASFESIREFAAIAFTLDPLAAIAPSSLSFVAATTGTVNIEVSLELSDTTGCLYDTSGGELISENVCWGEWETTGYLGPVRKVLIRAQSEEIAQTVSLSVSSLAFTTQ